MKPAAVTTYRVPLLAALLWAPRLCAASDDPILATDPDTIDTCIDWFNNGDGSDSCEYVRDLFKISPEQFSEWNPSIGLDCKPWLHPVSYCVSTSDRGPPPGVTTTTTTEEPITTTSVSTHVPSPTSWEYRGCYKDDPEHPVLDEVVIEDSSVDIASCQNTCWKASVDGEVLFAGVKDGNQCWCSDFVAAEVPGDDENCDKPCSGNKEQMCGGENYINIFNPVTTSATRSETATSIEASSSTEVLSSSAVSATTDSGAARRAAIL